MYAAITGTGKNKSVYIMQSFRKKNGRTSSRVHRKLGRLDDLLEKVRWQSESSWLGPNRKLPKIPGYITNSRRNFYFSFPICLYPQG